MEPSCVTLFLLISSAIGFASEIPLPGITHPESIGYDLPRQNFYVGSFDDGAIAQLDRNGNANLIQAAGTDGRKLAAGIKVDSKRRRLWVLDGSAAYIYDIDSNRLIRKIPRADVLPHEKSFLNDLVIDASGSAYITDSYAPFIYKVDGSSLKMSVFRDVSAIPFGEQGGMPFNLNGIVLTPDQKALLAIKTNEGTLWRIGIEDSSIREVLLSERLTKGDGLTWGEGNALYVIRNFDNKVSRLSYIEGSGRLNVKNLDVAGLRIPTSAAFVPGPRPSLFIVNSQFGVERPAPFTVLELPVTAKYTAALAATDGTRIETSFYVSESRMQDWGGCGVSSSTYSRLADELQIRVSSDYLRKHENARVRIVLQTPHVTDSCSGKERTSVTTLDLQGIQRPTPGSTVSLFTSRTLRARSISSRRRSPSWSTATG